MKYIIAFVFVAFLSGCAHKVVPGQEAACAWTGYIYLERGDALTQMTYNRIRAYNRHYWLVCRDGVMPENKFDSFNHDDSYKDVGLIYDIQRWWNKKSDSEPNSTRNAMKQSQ